MFLVFWEGVVSRRLYVQLNGSWVPEAQDRGAALFDATDSRAGGGNRTVHLVARVGLVGPAKREQNLQRGVPEREERRGRQH